ncbi:MAG: pyridoxal phosphate-dependent aminotransferase [Lachnospiraceae bacterium]|nr:pyridoxal phosphate-dependent aminotransferase [Lachnospiraceae bacterium]
MREFLKSSRLKDVYYDIRGAVVQEASRMSEAGMDILKLNIGNPAPFEVYAPEEMLETMRANLKVTEGYSESNGLLASREAVAAYCRKKGISGMTAKDVYLGNGVSEMILLAMQALLSEGDEVLVPAPDYPLWTAAVYLGGGNPVHYICDEQADWFPDLRDLRRKVTDRTKAIVLINPNNPTGALYPKDVLEEIVQVARENELLLFCDEIYDRLLMDGKIHTSVASLAPDVFTVTLNGLSKSHRLAGYRCGWMALSGPKESVKDYIEGLNMLASLRLCSNVPAQSLIPKALEHAEEPDPLYLPGGRIYEQRNFIWQAVNDIPGMSAVKPSAAFYLFPKLDTKRFCITDDEQFALDLLKQQRILIVQGRGFNWAEPDHFRIVYLPEMSQLERAAEGLRAFLADYRQG